MTHSYDSHGWYLSNSNEFEWGIEEGSVPNGAEAAYLKSVGSSTGSSGYISKSAAPAIHMGKRVRLTAWVKTSLEQGANAQLWIRVDADSKRKSGTTDNTVATKIEATSDWAQYSIVVKVPKSSRNIVFGLTLNGAGTAWLSDVSLETVEADISSTGLVAPIR